MANNSMLMPLQIERQYSGSLDANYSFDTLEKLKEYVQSALSYSGQILYCKENDTLYKVNNDKTDVASLGSGGDVIDDTLEESSVKTYSINKIKELMNKNGGYILVDVLPDLTDETERENIALNKIYLVPNGTDEDKNAKDEYICVYTEGASATYREALVTSDTDYDAWKTEIENYVAGGGSLDDDFDTYTATVTTTTMTVETYAEMVESINASDADYDTYVARITAIEVTPEIPETWTWERFGSLSGDAGLTWETDTIVSNPVGKVKKDDNLVNKSVLEIVTKMLQTDIPTTIKLVATPSTSTLYEKHVASITDVSLTATISLGTGVITEGADVVFKKNGVAIDTQSYATGTSIYTFTETGANVVDNATYSVEVKYNMDETEKTATDSVKYEFVLPIFYGTSATKEISNPEALTKVVEKAGKKKFTYSVTNGYCVIAVPTPYTVTEIIDQNGFSNTDSFDTVEQVVTIGTEPITYRVLTNKNACTCTNFSYTFTIA